MKPLDPVVCGVVLCLIIPLLLMIKIFIEVYEPKYRLACIISIAGILSLIYNMIFGNNGSVKHKPGELTGRRRV